MIGYFLFPSAIVAIADACANYFCCFHAAEDGLGDELRFLHLDRQLELLIHEYTLAVLQSP